MQRTSIKLATVAVGVALAATACGGSSDSSTASGATPAPAASDTMTGVTGQAATTTKAVELRAGLTYLLEEHVQLAGIATGTALANKGDLNAPAVKAAVATLDTNSVALSKAIGAAYPKAEAPFLASWRQHIGFFVDYTLGKATKDQAKADKAQKDLDGYRTSFGQLISSVVPELPADAVAEELKPHVASLSAAIDAQVAGDPKQFQLLQAAADHMPMTAATLAGGIATNLELGATDTKAADLRAGLTALLTQHVYAAGIAINTAVTKGGNLKDPMVTGAVSALDENSVALSKAIGAAYPKAEAPFLASWRQHIGFFVDYTLGKATKDQAKADKAQKDLDGYRTGFGQLISSVVPELPADAVAEELKPHVASLSTAIDAVVAMDPSAFAKLQTAAGHMPMTAATLSGGIAENLELA
jgi:hypothetical protein